MSDTTLGLSPAGGGAVDTLIRDVTTKSFQQDVIDESVRQPVLVDFWAPWCGPCKQLTPALEKVVRESKGKVKLAKMNTDDHPAIPGQLGIQSIPTVVAFVQGRPVDAFVGAKPEGQIKAFIDKLTKGMAPPADPLEEMLVLADEHLAAGEPQQAAELYADTLQQNPEELRAIAGLARASIAAGDLETAKQVLSMVPAGKEKDAGLAQARAELELAEQTAGLGDPIALQRRLDADPADHDARFDLALIANARGDRQAAADQLLEIFRRERNWNEDKARKQLVQFFEVWGPKDPATLAGRRRLSSLLFS